MTRGSKVKKTEKKIYFPSHSFPPLYYCFPSPLHPLLSASPPFVSLWPFHRIDQRKTLCDILAGKKEGDRKTDTEREMTEEKDAEKELKRDGEKGKRGGGLNFPFKESTAAALER